MPAMWINRTVLGALTVMAGLAAMGSVAQAQDQSEERNRRAVQTAFDAWRDGKGSVFDLLVPNATWTIVGNSRAAGTYGSRQEFIERVIEPFNARLTSRLVPSVRAIYADGDMVIVLFDAKATARDGKPYENTYTWYLRLREGRIVEAIAFFDSIVFDDFWTRVTPASNPPPSRSSG